MEQNVEKLNVVENKECTDNYRAVSEVWRGKSHDMRKEGQVHVPSCWL